MPDPGGRYMQCLESGAMEPKGQFSVLVVALEILPEEPAALLDDIRLGEHGAAGWTEYLLDGIETVGLLLVSSTIAPSTGGVGLSGRIENGWRVVVDYGGDDATTCGLLQEHFDTGFQPALLDDGIRVEDSDDRSSDITMSPTVLACSGKPAIAFSSDDPHTRYGRGFDPVRRIVATSVIDDKYLETIATGIVRDAVQALERHVRVPEDGDDQGDLCAGSFHEGVDLE